MMTGAREVVRRGVTLIDVAVSTVLLGAVLTTVAQVAHWTSAESRAAQKKRAALEAASSLLDRLTVGKWESLAPTRVKNPQLPAETSETLGGGRVHVTVDEENGSLPARRVTVDVSWPARSGTSEEHAQLTSWVYRRENAR